VNGIERICMFKHKLYKKVDSGIQSSENKVPVQLDGASSRSRVVHGPSPSSSSNKRKSVMFGPHLKNHLSFKSHSMMMDAACERFIHFLNQSADNLNLNLDGAAMCPLSSCSSKWCTSSSGC
jgi:hypothetical protein